MPRGKPWDIEDEKKLKDWFLSGIKDYGVLSFSFDGKYSKNAIYQKLLDVGLIETEDEWKNATSSPQAAIFKLPAELPTMEVALKRIVAAWDAIEQPGLSKTEVMRLRGAASLGKIYREMYPEYVHYRELEDEVLDLRKKYAELRRKTSTDKDSA